MALGSSLGVTKGEATASIHGDNFSGQKMRMAAEFLNGNADSGWYSGSLDKGNG
jgi:hypothetical protein